jgi:hypothetical protein
MLWDIDIVSKMFQINAAVVYELCIVFTDFFYDNVWLMSFNYSIVYIISKRTEVLLQLLIQMISLIAIHCICLEMKYAYRWMNIYNFLIKHYLSKECISKEYLRTILFSKQLS